MIDRFLTVFRSLNEHEVRYLVIGGVAAVMHGVPRMTFDLDLLIDPTAANARRVLDALLAVGLGTASLITPEQLLSKEITIFNDVIRIDVQTRTPGIEFDDAWPRRSDLAFKGEPIHFVSRDDLIRSKEAAGRSIDRNDAQVLRSLAAEEPPASIE